MGDDLRLVYAAQHGGYASSPIQGLLHPELGTYRPLLALIFSLIVPLFGANFALYQTLNTVVEAASAVVISLIAFRLSRENVVIALATGVAFVFSRFANYAIGQVFGIMEGLALLFTLLLISDVVSAYRRAEYAPLLRGMLWFGFVLFTDERYVALLPFVLCAVILVPGQIESRRSWTYGLLILALAIAGTNVATKSFLFHTQFLWVNGQALAFNPSALLRFINAGLLNVIGFNVGPAFLAAEDVADVGIIGYVLALLIAVPCCFAALALVRTLFATRSVRARKIGVFLWLTLFVPLLLTACVSFRQEFRWLYAPYAISLLGLAATAGCFPNRRRAVSMSSACFVAGTLASAILYRAYIGNLYFVYSEQIAEQVAQIFEKEGNAPTVIVTHGERSVDQWIFMESEFFEEYQLGRGRPFYVNNAADVARLALLSAPVVIDVKDTTVTESEPTTNDAMAATRKQKRLLSMTAAFSSGKISSLTPALTPTGRGVFINAWPSPAGGVSSLTVLPSYRYGYPNIRIVPHERLTFVSAMPYASLGGARAYVDVTDGTVDARLYDEFLPPASAEGPLWQAHNISLDRFAGKTVTLIFGADFRDGDPGAAAWVAFGDPALVRDDAAE